MCNLDDHYAANSVAAAVAIGAGVAETGHDSDSVFSALPYSTERNAAKLSSLQGKANDSVSISNMSKNFR